MSSQKPLIIGISGFGGSGKSTFASILANQIQAPVVVIDSFIIDRTKVDYANWELMNFARLEREVLIPFLKGQALIRYGHFNWQDNAASITKEISGARRLIVEGVGLFRPSILPYLNYKIWIDCPMDAAIARGKKRDREEYHNPQDGAWDGIWKKNDLEYVQNYSPREKANALFDNSGAPLNLTPPIDLGMQHILKAIKAL